MQETESLYTLGVRYSSILLTPRPIVQVAVSSTMQHQAFRRSEADMPRLQMMCLLSRREFPNLHRYLLLAGR